MSARLAVLVLVAACAACATEPGLPLLSPLATAKSFGYAETPRGADRYSVTYATPTRSSFRSPESDASDAEGARTLGYDMAVWRAAQIAAAAGYEGFHVADRQTDVTFYPDPIDRDFPPLLWGPGWWSWRQPLAAADGPWPPSRLLLAARVTIEVRLLHAPGADDYDAAAIMAKLAQTYPGADGTPARP
jgi:hypothetical protein